MASSRRYLFPALAAVVVVAAIAAGLMTVGSPASQRMRRLDERRVEDLIEVTRKANAYWSQHGTLPAAIEPLLTVPGTTTDGRDPSTGHPYGYAPQGGRRYELCAEFAQPSSAPREPERDRFWLHPAGRHCFRLEARTAPADRAP
jgi:hypothetical protein